jgi:hypothetical protein
MRTLRQAQPARSNADPVNIAIIRIAEFLAEQTAIEILARERDIQRTASLTP